MGRLALALVDAETARLVRPRVCVNGFFQHDLDSCCQFERGLARRTGGRRDGRRATPRRKPGVVQRLARVDVANAGDEPLIEQQDLERDALSHARARQHQRVERVAERLRPHRAQRLVVIVGANQIHQPEAARIVERHDDARRQHDDDVIVWIGRR